MFSYNPRRNNIDDVFKNPATPNSPQDKQDLANKQVEFIDPIISRMGDTGQERLKSWLTIEIKSEVARRLGVTVVNLGTAEDAIFEKVVEDKYSFYICKLKFNNSRENNKQYSARWHTYIPGEYASPQPCLRISKLDRDQKFYLLSEGGKDLVVTSNDGASNTLANLRQQDLSSPENDFIKIQTLRFYDPVKDRMVQQKRYWAITDPNLNRLTREMNTAINMYSHIPFLPVCITKSTHSNGIHKS